MRPRKLGESYNEHDHEIDQNCIEVLDKGFVRLVDMMGNDSSIAQAARVSYGEGTKKIHEDIGLIRYLMRNKHTTPFEMVQLKFHIKAPIFIFRQWHRSRTWSYNEYSGRYSIMKDEYYVPEEDKVTKQNPHNKQGGTNEIVPYEDIFTEDLAGNSWLTEFEEEQKNIRAGYERKIASGMRKELARINLPLSQYSEMYASVNLHNLFHFLELRLDDHAQYETRVYGQAIKEIVKQKVPVAYQAFEEYILNSMQLTQLDQEVLRELAELTNSLNTKVTPTLIESVCIVHFANKREREECINKMTKLFLNTTK